MPANRLYTPTPEETDAAVAALVLRQPGERNRFAKAGALVLAGAVGHDGSGWTVTSQDKYRAGQVYAVTPTSCQCYDHAHAHGGQCKHQDAVRVLASVLGAKLDAAIRPLSALCAGLAVVCSSQAEAEAALAAALADPVLGDDVLYVIPAQADNYSHLYARADDAHICTALQMPSGAWRPATAADTLAWARWLGAGQGEVEGVGAAVEPVTPAAGLAAVLAAAPGAVTLRADVIYGATRRYLLSGYRYAGSLWVRLEHAERTEFDEATWGATLKAAGFEMLQRPVKQPGITYHYLLTRTDGAADGTRYQLHHVAADTLERDAQTAVFAAISAATGDGLVNAPEPHTGASGAFAAAASAWKARTAYMGAPDGSHETAYQYAARA